MEMFKHVLLLCLIAILIPMYTGIPVEDSFKNLGTANSKEKITNLHFYWHEELMGVHPTTLAIVKPSTYTPTSPFPFGFTGVGDIPLRSGPENFSKLVGRAQGLASVTDQSEVSFLMVFNFEFTEGEFNGSTLSLIGRNPIGHTFREMPIVGGTGVFRLARGIATVNTFLYNSTTGQVVVEHNIVVLHY